MKQVEISQQELRIIEDSLRLRAEIMLNVLGTMPGKDADRIQDVLNVKTKIENEIKHRGVKWRR